MIKFLIVLNLIGFILLYLSNIEIYEYRGTEVIDVYYITPVKLVEKITNYTNNCTILSYSCFLFKI